MSCPNCLCPSCLACTHDFAALVAEARKQSEELAIEGVNGTPNLLVALADALEGKP
jgi:hypothetical protein